MLQTADSVRLVLWFKGKGDTPIYTYDMRKGKEKKKKKKESERDRRGESKRQTDRIRKKRKCRKMVKWFMVIHTL